MVKKVENHGADIVVRCIDTVAALREGLVALGSIRVPVCMVFL